MLGRCRSTVLSDIQTLKFYETKEHSCSYLEGKEATTIFVDPHAQLNGDIYGRLSDYGFRRSGRHVYRPNCKECRACIPIRIPVDAFTASRSQTRCLKRNKDLSVTIVESIDDDQHYSLYEKYITERHADGDMFPANRAQYRDFLTAEWGITRFLDFHDEQRRLVAVGIVDQLENGFSAVYFYFDPSEEKRSLGMFNILHLIDFAKKNDLPFVYLGYWIKDCQKMSYKTRYQPFQVLIGNSWLTVTDMDPLL